MDYNEFWENPTMQASEQLAPLPAEIFISAANEDELVELVELDELDAFSANELIELNLFIF